MLLQNMVMVGDEDVTVVAFGRTFGKARANDLYSACRSRNRVMAATSIAGIGPSVNVAKRSINFNK